uniref:SAC domain-containing protein n=1 Tax=Kalanchoe fedtschenkoi TaxID=63787 RepID=A0A7N0VEA0_KALFE
METTGSPSNSAPQFRLHDQLQLLEFADRFVVKSVASPDRGFSICLRDGNVEVLADDTSAPNPCKVSTIYGIAGTIRLLTGTYLLVITSRKEVGKYFGSSVFLVTSMKFVSCNEASRLSTSYEKRDEAYFMSLLKTVESTPGLYYSYDTDMTVNLQRRVKLADGWSRKPLWKQADPRFVWNRNLLEELIEYKLDEFIIPLQQGNILMLFGSSLYYYEDMSCQNRF